MAGDFQTGAKAFESQDYIQAVASWEPLAKNGHVVAQKSLAVIYEKGLGVPVNDSRAAYWYGKAAAQGHATAQLRLAVAYAFGRGVKTDYVRAYVWLAHAMARFPAGKNRDKAIELKAWVAKLMSAEDRAQAEAEIAAYAQSGDLIASSSPPRRLDYNDPTSFRTTVLDFVKRTKLTGDTLFAGTLHMLGFEDVKAKAGAEWPAIRDEIGRIIDETIERHLTELDLYLRIGDEKIVLLFGSSLKYEAEAQARAIGIDLENLFSTVIPGGVEINVTATTAALNLSLEQAIDFSALVKSVDQANQVADQARAASAAAITSVARDRGRLLYWPVLNLAKKRVSAYAAELILTEDELAKRATEKDGALDSELDRVLLEKVSQDAAELTGKRGHKAIVILPIHFETLANRQHRQTYFNALQAVQAGGRRRIILHVADLPTGVPQTRLHQVLSPMAGLILGFALRVLSQFKDFDRLAGSKVPILALNRADFPKFDSTHAQSVTDLVARSNERGCRVYFGGIEDVAVGKAARKTGVAYLGGQAIVPSVSRFGPSYKIG